VNGVYHAPDGVYAVATISTIQKLAQTSNGSIHKNGTLIGTMGDDIMLYNAATGAYEVATILCKGALHDSLLPSNIGEIGKGFQTVVRSNGHLLWYNPSTRHAYRQFRPDPPHWPGLEAG
jgi:hypothetical protein